MNKFRCESSKANYVGMYPPGCFYCGPEDEKEFFELCVDYSLSVLQKPDRERQKLILDLDSKEEKVSPEIIKEIKKEVEFYFRSTKIPISICRRKESFGVHLHFLGVLVDDKVYKNLTKYLKSKFPIVDTSPFNHFIPGCGKPGKPPYLPKSGKKYLKNYCTEEKYCLTKNMTSFDITKMWNFLIPFEMYEPPKVRKEVKREVKISKITGDKLDYIISFCEEIYQTHPDCDIWNDYNKWIKVGFVLTFFDRNDLWHKFSSLSEKYDEIDCDKKWDELEKKTKYGNPKIIINMLKKERFEFDPPPVLNRKEMIRNEK